MSQSTKHDQHGHIHGPSCGHTGVKHEGHTDYLHEGHLHNAEQDEVAEHVIKEGVANPSVCTPDHACGGHDAKHAHGTDCGHEAVPHGNHIDYLVNGHLHYLHGDHCDEHGPILSGTP